ncbi:hypothetical protein IEN85_10070 [Pelagicoccus sp. NFK12]|uniref:Uncharacterized protein n=1 Tax=Pelagicoccus enzymogenes TaxID=2773457 RepID=A0A927F8J9_9BACT|nr:hypothetical protein [Pelagicoccus enzymogenes]MBD5779839.1 hypothetical protein [Pelagicoccus enzymogenes]MDQ8201124.1 hypothetical protein [Pelagicoccus enzymogenes]
MSEEPAEIDPQQEHYVYAITRRLFKYTLVGTVLFAATIIGIWYLFHLVA